METDILIPRIRPLQRLTRNLLSRYIFDDQLHALVAA
jgi:hypothetical protein